MWRSALRDVQLDGTNTQLMVHSCLRAPLYSVLCLLMQAERLLQSDFVFITNNNPRLEAPEDIVAQTTAGFPPHIHAYEVQDSE